MTIFRDNEVPSGLINGSNTVFLLSFAPYPQSSLLLTVNGVLQVLGVDYFLDGNQITMVSPPQAGYVLRAWYRVESDVGTDVGTGLYRDDAVQIIMDRLGQRTGLETLIIRHMQAAQQTLQSKPTLPWFLVRTWDFTTSQPYEPVPHHFLREVEDVCPLMMIDTVGSPLEKLDYDFLITSPDYAGRGKPTAYAVQGGRIYLFKAPDKSYDFRFMYYAADAPLTSNIKNHWLMFASDLLIAATGISVAKSLRDLEAAALFERDFAVAWADFIRADTARRFAGLRSSFADYSA